LGCVSCGNGSAKQQSLFDAGQDLLKTWFSGNVRGMGPAVAEMEIEERPAEPFLFFAADKTDTGAFNLPLYLAFVDPMSTPGLLLSPNMLRGFRFVIMAHGRRRIIETERARRPLRHRRVAPFATAHFVAGGMRGSHNMPLMPVPLGTGTSYFDGPPLVTRAGFCAHQGKLTEPMDNFGHPFWNTIREMGARKSVEMRRQGFFGAAMLPMAELEYTGIKEETGAARFEIFDSEQVTITSWRAGQLRLCLACWRGCRVQLGHLG
jgi:fructose 1,6-bisphosphate aldolase/phosphatase